MGTRTAQNHQQLNGKSLEYFPPEEFPDENFCSWHSNDLAIIIRRRKNLII